MGPVRSRDALTTTWELMAEGLTKSYGGRCVVNGVTLGLDTGEVVGLLGPNGAGKTTSFYMMVGLVKPEKGRVLLGGVDVTRSPMHLRAQGGIGYLPQEASLFRGLTVEENLMLIYEMRGMSREEADQHLVATLQEFGLERLRHQNVCALSGGEQRRLEISRALATNPRYLLLDEPFTGVDPLHVAEIQDIVRVLKTRGIGILITDHNAAALLQLVDRVYIIREGEILVHGSPQEVVEHRLARQYYLGESFAMPTLAVSATANGQGASSALVPERGVHENP